MLGNTVQSTANSHFFFFFDGNHEIELIRIFILVGHKLLSKLQIVICPCVNLHILGIPIINNKK